MATKPPNAARHRAGNLEAAGAILENIARYGGDDVLLVKWARLFMEVLSDRDKAAAGAAGEVGVPEILQGAVPGLRVSHVRVAAFPS